MKKQLLCTSAIALGIAAAPAAAQEWDLDWGGYMRTHVAISDIDVGGANVLDFAGEGVSLYQEGEIIFTPSITLDNGLTFGINVQLEAENVNNIDETYVSISSDTFGRLDIGAENSAGYKLMTGAPGVTSMFINSPSTTAFIPFSVTGVDVNFRQAAASSFTEVAGNNDVNRITYYTPDFNGLTVGISYAPTGAANANTGPGSAVKDLVLSDIFDIGVNYSGTIGQADVTLAARWGTGDAPDLLAAVTAGGDGVLGSADDGVAFAPNTDSDPETWGVGFSVGYQGFTVGGSYSENDNGAANGAGDEEGWSFGVTYDTSGPWSFEALTYQGEIDGGAPNTDLEREAYRIGASRTLGPGVDWDIYVVYEERDLEATPFTEVSGTIFGTALNLSF